MKAVICLVLVTIIGIYGATKRPNFNPAFTSYEITPDVVSVPPAKVIKVQYKNTHKEANLGNQLAPKDVREAPDVHFDAEADAFYTLVMTDPDAPSHRNPTMKEWNHWLVGNIPGNDVAKGEVLTEYVGSGPPKDTGLHRYIFLVYKQPGKIKFDEPHKSNTDGKRGKFSTQNFAKKYKLGDPVGGNFFEAKFDDSVPELHKQLH